VLKNSEQKPKGRRFYLLFFLTCLLLGLLAFFYPIYQKAFRLDNVTIDAVDLPASVKGLEWGENENVPAFFTQPFYYLGEGNQIYAFVSSDSRYVIKIFKFGHLKPKFWDHWIPGQEIRERRRQRKMHRLFHAYFLAYHYDRKATKLIYAHLNKSDAQLPVVGLQDRYGLHHQIALDDVYFVLQERGEPLNKRMHKALSKGDVEQGKKMLGKILNMYLSEYRLGICDLDYNLWHNTGFCEDNPMRIDVGKIIKDPKYTEPDEYLKDLKKVHNRIFKWLQRYYPQYQADFQTFLKE